MGNPIQMGERCVSGAEHQVWLDEARKLAHKIPHSLGRLWQKMEVRFAERDLGVLQEYDIPIVPTRVHGESTLLLADLTRRETEMVLEQPLLRPSHPMSYGDLFHDEIKRSFLLEMVRKGEALYREKGLGLDLLGGKAVFLTFPALNPFRKKMEAEVGNLLIADQDIQTPEAWVQNDRRKIRSLVGSGFDRRKSNAIAKEGEIRLCDVRLFDFDQGPGLYGRNLALLLRQIHRGQYAALWTLLEGFGIKPEIKFETRFEQWVRALIRQATPKMRAMAEETG
jgi:hypothetical protein